MPTTSTYPAIIDTFVDPSPSSDQAVLSHAAQHAKANDALAAVQTELGTLPKGTAADVKTRITAAEAATAAEVARATQAEALAAPLSAPALTGAATLGGVAIETTAGSQTKATAALNSALAAIAALPPSGAGALAIVYSAGSYALRSTATASSTTPVEWRGPVAPTIGGGYMLTIDTWTNTGSVA